MLHYHLKIIQLLIDRSSTKSILIFNLFLVLLFPQSELNPNMTKFLIKEKKAIIDKNQKQLYKYPINFILNHYFYFNTNLPNLENHNGFYLPKGSGNITSFLIEYNGRFLTLTGEPQIRNINQKHIFLPKKEKMFSKLNDVPLNNESQLRINNFRNLGVKFHINKLTLGYGNWDQWWGPGIHNSIVLTNNAEGFDHFFVESNGIIPINNNKILYDFKYVVSDKIKNQNKNYFYLTSSFLKIRFKNFELGASKQILSGGNSDLDWGLREASMVLVTNRNINQWDQIYDIFLLYHTPYSGLKVFFEMGFPNRFFSGKNISDYRDHAMGSNLGLRKYGVFNIDELMFGVEYTRLVQGIYYNVLPTSNWYDNHKYDYSSFNGRRWAAHSGADSDDFLLYAGYLKGDFSLISGINYERHGVTYHFPPEVKLEYKLAASVKYRNTFVYINYENEYFEHYGFVDSNENVWLETFENYSIQRTQTVLISIEYRFPL